jgi:hypothetical protein
MASKTKKILKIIAKITLIESIASFAGIIAMIGGIIYIVSKTGHNLVLGISACIVYAFVIIYVIFKVEKIWNNFFKNK